MNTIYQFQNHNICITLFFNKKYKVIHTTHAYNLRIQLINLKAKIFVQLYFFE